MASHITHGQLDYIESLPLRLGHDTKPLGSVEVNGRRYHSLSDLTREDASGLIDHLLERQ